jgi:cyclic pyranopterin phosphate synthase
MKELSHTDEHGRAVMVDVSRKKEQLRIARAQGRITMGAETLALVSRNLVKKGDVLTLAEVAGIQGAKEASRLIPLCHPLQLGKVDVKARLEENGVLVQSEVRCVGRTGVEMEALASVSVALLTIYDMCKKVDRNMKIEEIYLTEKVKYDIQHDESGIS